MKCKPTKNCPDMVVHGMPAEPQSSRNLFFAQSVEQLLEYALLPRGELHAIRRSQWCAPRTTFGFHLARFRALGLVTRQNEGHGTETQLLSFSDRTAFP